MFPVVGVHDLLVVTLNALQTDSVSLEIPGKGAGTIAALRPTGVFTPCFLSFLNIFFSVGPVCHVLNLIF